MLTVFQTLQIQEFCVGSTRFELQGRADLGWKNHMKRCGNIPRHDGAKIEPRPRATYGYHRANIEPTWANIGSRQFFSVCLNDDQISALEESAKKTITFEVELITVIVAIKLWLDIMKQSVSLITILLVSCHIRWWKIEGQYD